MTTSRSEVSFQITAEPVPASRPKFGRGGRTYYPKTHMAYEEALRRQLLGLPEFRTDQPCELRMLFVQQPFKTVDRSVSRMDLDNLSKLPMDTMTKCEDETGTRRYWLDDSLIVSLVALKRFAAPGEESHTKVRIIPVEDVSAHVDRLFWS